jgi:phosphate transport system substrate-binding protein
MKLASIAAATVVAAAVAFGGAASAQDITGAGGTFPAPVYAKWGEAASQAIGVKLNYAAIGSGGGQNQIFNRTVDFGASDAPVPANLLQQHNLYQFPSVMGAVVAIVNIPGVAANQLKMSGEMLADIYAGKITKWNDPQLVEMNKGVKLPSLAIAPVYRADSSGTSFVWTSYLAAVSPSWQSSVGAGQSVKWPVGNGARGNDGVAATVKQVRGGIGYVEWAYANTNHLVTVELRNKSGHFVDPSMASFGAAAKNADWANAQNFVVNLIDQNGDDSWPVVSATFILLPKDPKDPARSAAVEKFFGWCYQNGDKIALDLQYIPLPDSVKSAVEAGWKTQIKS